LEALYMAEQYAEANLLAYRISFQMLEKREFIKQYVQILRKNNDTWGALVEAARYHYLFGESCDSCFHETIEQDIVDVFEKSKRYSFLVYTSEKGIPFDFGKENIAIGLLLRRLGNTVSFMHKEQSFYPHKPGYIDIVNASKEYTIIPYGIPCKCSQYLYTDAEDSHQKVQLISGEGKERVCLVSTFDSLTDCVLADCKKIVFWYNESTKEEKINAEKWLNKQGDEHLQKKVVFIPTGKKDFVIKSNKQIDIEDFYKREQYMYELVYTILQELEK